MAKKRFQETVEHGISSDADLGPTKIEDGEEVTTAPHDEPPTFTPKLELLYMSHWNWPVDWDKLREECPDLQAIMWVASSGTYLNDAHFPAARDEAARFGLKFGAVHILSGDTPYAQVHWFLNTIGEIGDDLRLALHFSGAQTLPVAQVWLGECGMKAGRTPTLYMTGTAHSKMGNLESAVLGHYPLWIQRHSNHPADVPLAQPSWKDWAIWEYAAENMGLDPKTAPVHGNPACSTFRDPAAVLDNWACLISEAK